MEVRERLFCQYEELSADNVYNQILKSVLHLLLPLVSASEARKRLSELLMRFDAISDVDVNLSLFNQLTFDRSNNRYKPIFEQCRWFIEGFHPDVVTGQASCLTLLFDMNRLFEAYVASELRQWAWKQGLRLKEQGPQKYLARRKDTGEKLFLMKPDMAFLDTANHVVMIADAKWKLLDENEKKLGIAQSDLYQIVSYAIRYSAGKLALIYPRQRQLNHPVELNLQGISANLTIIPLDITSPNVHLLNR